MAQQPTYHPRRQLERARIDIVEIITDWLNDRLSKKGVDVVDVHEAVEQRIDIEIIDAVRRVTGNYDEELPPAA
jgi:hypothetical protein